MNYVKRKWNNADPEVILISTSELHVVIIYLNILAQDRRSSVVLLLVNFSSFMNNANYGIRIRNIQLLSSLKPIWNLYPGYS